MKRSGLEPLYGARERHPISEEKKNAVKRSFNLKMSNPDIAYFIGVPSYVVRNYFVESGKNKGSKHNLVKSFGNPDAYLTYRGASQVYEGGDIGFGQKEIEEVLGLDRRVVSYALKNRTRLEPKIIEALRTIYPDREISKPYLEQRTKSE